MCVFDFHIVVQRIKRQMRNSDPDGAVTCALWCFQKTVCLAGGLDQLFRDIENAKYWPFAGDFTVTGWSHAKGQ